MEEGEEGWGGRKKKRKEGRVSVPEATWSVQRSAAESADRPPHRVAFDKVFPLIR